MAEISLGPQMWPPAICKALEIEVARLLSSVHPSSLPGDIRVADIEGTMYRLDPGGEGSSVVKLSAVIPGYAGLRSIGMDVRLSEVYGSLLSAPTDGSDVSMDLRRDDAVPLHEVCKSVASLRQHVSEWPFLYAAQAVAGGSGGRTPAIALLPRPGQPTFIIPRSDQLVVSLVLASADPTERALLRTVAQELAEAKSGGGGGGAPSVVFSDRSDSLPPEARALVPSVTVASASDVAGYITLTCFPRHVERPAQAANTAAILAGFRFYLDYHVAASKTYMHARMRTRLDGWLQGLQDARRPDPFAAAEKKTASGRAFTPKV